MEGITPIHIDDTVSSLSAILLYRDYYKVLLDGKIVVNGLSIFVEDEFYECLRDADY